MSSAGTERGSATPSAWAGQPPTRLADLDLRRAFRQYAHDYGPYLPADRAAPILDFGCGWGALLAYLARERYRAFEGVDVDPRCVAFCRARITPSVQHVADSRAFLAERRGTYAAIVMRQVAYYFPPTEIVSYLTAAREALAPEGRLIVQVFNGALFTGAYPRYNDRHITTVFTEHSLRWALESAGFHEPAIFGATLPARGVRQALWQAGRRVWWRALLAIYVLERGLDSLNPTIFERDIVAVARAGR
jgi:SAM-dependent methyltransferase